MRKKGRPSIKKKNTFPGLRGRIWIDGNEGTFLAYGRIVLLEKIRELGSITKAAGSMDISYRHAWQLIDSMNRQSKRPLVTTASGGRGGGGTKLTVEGEKAVEVYWKLYENFQDFLKREKKKLLKKGLF